MPHTLLITILIMDPKNADMYVDLNKLAKFEK